MSTCDGPYCVCSYRKEDEKSWRIPTWSHPLGRVVTPLFMKKDDGTAVPIGSGFCIFSGGIFLTAGHVLDELYKHAVSNLDGHHFVQVAGKERRIKSLLGRSPETRKVGAPMMALSVRSDEYDTEPVFVFGESRFGSAVEPSDVGLFAVDLTRTNSPNPWRWESLPVTSNFPRPGETVYCIGHHNYKTTNYMPYEDIEDFDGSRIMRQLDHDFRVSIGVVTDVYVEKYVTGYAEGPCFRIDCALEHGQSGGPVINSEGYVCGINMCATLDDDENSCLAAAIAPALGGLSTIPESMSVRERLPRKVSLARMIKSGLIATDDSLRNIAMLKSHGLETYMPLQTAVLTAKRDGNQVPEEARKKCGDLSGFHLTYEDQSGA